MKRLRTLKIVLLMLSLMVITLKYLNLLPISISATLVLVILSGIFSIGIEWYCLYTLGKEDFDEHAYYLKLPILHWNNWFAIPIVIFSILSKTDFSIILLIYGALLVLEEIGRIVLQLTMKYHRVFLTEDFRLIYYGKQKYDINLAEIKKIKRKKDDDKVHLITNVYSFTINTKWMSKSDREAFLLLLPTSMKLQHKWTKEGKLPNKKDNQAIFKLSDLKYSEEAQLKGEYGMWWYTKEDPSFFNSQTRNHFDEIYEAIKGFESYMLGHLLSECKVKGFEDFRRINLPEVENSIVVQGPENKKIVISFSKEKGIRFHFPIAEVSSMYRNNFLDQIRSSLIAFRAILQFKQVKEDELKEPNGYDWYHYMTRVIREKEEKGTVIINEGFTIGGITYD